MIRTGHIYLKREQFHARVKPHFIHINLREAWPVTIHHCVMEQLHRPVKDTAFFIPLTRKYVFILKGAAHEIRVLSGLKRECLSGRVCCYIIALGIFCTPNANVRPSAVRDTEVWLTKLQNVMWNFISGYCIGVRIQHLSDSSSRLWLFSVFIVSDICHY
jgi:hypothetical protein